MLRYLDGKPYVTNPYHVNEMPRNELMETIYDCFPSDKFVLEFFHQKQDRFVPLEDEDTGFLIFTASKK